ncbi:hypothetical protein A361_19860 [Cytobacillus oceanisediminis 2691]|uniref:Uncharacterized protein n=2 Tax=Cytobacillus oceanisediminis TaxID=665099 RepID=A0A169FVI1_9BACI|nr:hypothetical protein A361_19860 [Cytobacillus oceanisediminis 2691]OHX48840.1 hypothetical protein BBV17_15990 [Cytobacillus oceanisediminis]
MDKNIFYRKVDLRCGHLILENAIAFPSCGVHSRRFIQCSAGGEGRERREAEEALIPPRGKAGVPRAEINGLLSEKQQSIRAWL